jgi:hypothetical protein
VDWHAACIALKVVSAVLVVFSSGEQIPEETSQILLTNKKQGTWTSTHPTTTLFSQSKLALTARNTLFAL